MAKKQNNPVIDSKEGLMLNWDTSDLKAKWQQADRSAQAAFQQVIDKSQRLVAITQSIKVASSDERKSLHQERQTLQLELEALPYEAGALKREAILAHLNYLKTEDQRLQEWDDLLEAEGEKCYDPEQGGYVYSQAYDEALDALEQAKRQLQDLINESGLNSMEWGWQGWKGNEAKWVEYAETQQDQTTQLCLNTQDMVFKGTWGVPFQHERIILYKE